MTYINNLEKEDLQNDTFTLIAALIMGATSGQMDKNPYTIYENLDAVWTLVWSRVSDKELRDRIDEGFDDLSTVLYSGELNPEEMSRAFEQAKSLFRLMTKELNDMELLFKVVVNPGQMVAH